MWWFAGGVFMLHLQDEDLRLTAIYGLVIAASDSVLKLSNRRISKSEICHRLDNILGNLTSYHKLQVYEPFYVANMHLPNCFKAISCTH